MTKKKRKNPWDAVPPYAQVEQRLVDSEAFKNLKAHTKWLYVEFRLRYHGNNPREITFKQKEAMKIMDVNTFREDYRILVKRGFIDLVKRGGFYNQPHTFGLSKRWEKYGTKEFEEIDIDKLFPQKIFRKK